MKTTRLDRIFQPKAKPLAAEAESRLSEGTQERSCPNYRKDRVRFSLRLRHKPWVISYLCRSSPQWPLTRRIVLLLDPPSAAYWPELGPRGVTVRQRIVRRLVSYVNPNTTVYQAYISPSSLAVVARLS